MSFPYTPNPKDEKNASLQTQYDYLRLLRLRQLQWMNSADDLKTREIHLEISKLLEGIIDHYRRLLDAPPPQDKVDLPSVSDSRTALRGDPGQVRKQGGVTGSHSPRRK